ncbi:MAG: class II aldolase/adducin family protein [bacterium]|nr:MAG: class II aldolase/adducin family protein [bacterium]
MVCNMDLSKKSLVIHTFGNVSGIERTKGIVAIKPGGIPYSELIAEKIVLIDLENKTVDSN